MRACMYVVFSTSTCGMYKSWGGDVPTSDSDQSRNTILNFLLCSLLMNPLPRLLLLTSNLHPRVIKFLSFLPIHRSLPCCRTGSSAHPGVPCLRIGVPKTPRPARVPLFTCTCVDSPLCLLSIGLFDMISYILLNQFCRHKIWIYNCGTWRKWIESNCMSTSIYISLSHYYSSCLV